MLLWAFNPTNPYGYYILLRRVVCGIFAFLAVRAFRQKLEGWVWIMGITAAIYNPIIRVYLTREIWSVTILPSRTAGPPNPDMYNTTHPRERGFGIIY